MAKTLIIVESPKKAKTISKYLDDKYIVLASYGHVMDLSSSSQRPWGIDIKNNFKPYYNIISEKTNLINSLIGTARGVEKILLASDPDREGEAIACHLKSCLESTGKEIKRIVFNEITEKEIKKSVKNPRDLDLQLFDSQQSRRVLDRIVGYAVSSYLRNGKDYGSAGRVQSVALKMIVNREEEIEKFKPEAYYVIKALGLKDGQSFEIKHKNVQNKIDAEKIVKSLEEKDLTVTKVKSEEKEKPAKAPFTTLTMCSAAHTELGLSAAQTMKIAQNLYEDGFITYMRTDSTRVSKEAIESVRKYLTTAGYEIPAKPNIYSVKGNAQDAHEAIRPSDIETLPNNIYTSPENVRLYTLIWNRFAASQLKPARYATLDIDLNNSLYSFKSRGKSLIFKGWLEILDEKEKDISVPKLEKGEIVKPIKPFAQEKWTTPLPRYNERTLIEELENKGIGRPSTYATIIPKILERKYISKNKEVYSPEQTGVDIIKELSPFFSFLDYNYTAAMEKELDEIACGRLKYDEMLNKFYSSFKKELAVAYATNRNKSDLKCPKCDSLTEKFINRGIEYYHCINFPTCDFKSRVIEEKEITDYYKPCFKCGFFTILNEGTGYWGCLRYPRCIQ